ncbi:hypothetical protein [Larkinella rosea]|uniref:Uncharacterized protein n=1 Tax=Larkinella rosea TaxID=2025312 RepID=A0A3P1BRX6_9BACT|nr:hypothetical protein [Larkinella rosea]RRB03822.1 hypothetical protein EHT25_09795 [Larkinella rosea]
MESIYKAFKEIELPDACPPNVKEELISEIDLIRNSLSVVEVYVDDLFSVASALLSIINLPSRSSHS